MASVFNTSYEKIPGATNRVFDNTKKGPETVTKITGLTPGQYNVYIVCIYANPDGKEKKGRIRLQANLNGLAVDGKVYNALDITEKMATNTNHQWAVGLAPIGTTAADVTGFTVNLDDAEIDERARISYIGIAYKTAEPQPGPSALLSLGDLSLTLRRCK